MLVCRGAAGTRRAMADNGSNAKQQQLDGSRVSREPGYLTTQQGVRVDHPTTR